MLLEDSNGDSLQYKEGVLYSSGAVNAPKFIVTDGTSSEFLKADGSLDTTTYISTLTEASGILPVANGGTGSSTQNFVDLTSDQTIAGVKTFSDDISAANLSGTNTGDETAETIINNLGNGEYWIKDSTKSLRIPCHISVTKTDGSSNTLIIYESRATTGDGSYTTGKVALSKDNGASFTITEIFNSDDWLQGGSIVSNFGCKNPLLVASGNYVYAFCTLYNDTVYGTSYPFEHHMTHDIVYKYSSDYGETWSSVISLKNNYSTLWSDLGTDICNNIMTSGRPIINKNNDWIIVPLHFFKYTSDSSNPSTNPYVQGLILVIESASDPSSVNYYHSQLIPFQTEEMRIIEVNNDINDSLQVMTYSRYESNTQIPVYMLEFDSTSTLSSNSWTEFWPVSRKIETANCNASMQVINIEGNRYGIMTAQTNKSARDRLELLATSDFIYWHSAGVIYNYADSNAYNYTAGSSSAGYSSVYYNETTHRLSVVDEPLQNIGDDDNIPFIRFKDISYLIPAVISATGKEFTYFVEGTTSGVTASTYSRDGLYDYPRIDFYPETNDQVVILADAWYQKKTSKLTYTYFNQGIQFYSNSSDTSPFARSNDSNLIEGGSLTNNLASPSPDVSASQNGIKISLQEPDSSNDACQITVTGYSADSENMYAIYKIKDIITNQSTR